MDTNAQSLYFEDISPNQFPLLLSGRHNLVYANLNLVLSKRHDIAQMLGTILFGRWVDVQRDRLWIEIPIVRTDKIKCELLIVKQRELKAVKKS